MVMPMENRRLKAKMEGTGLLMLNVVGLSYYNGNVSSLFANPNPRHSLRNDQSKTFLECDARLVSEPSNPHDPNAIAVFVDGKQVGHLDRGMAAKLTRQVKRSGYDELDATCRGLLVSLDNGFGDLLYSMRLDVCTNKQKKGAESNGSLIDFEFFVDKPGLHVDPNVAILGSRVRFWVDPKSPSSIYVYPEYDPYYESERVPLGLIPAEYVSPFFKHLEEKHSYEAKLAAITDGGWQIAGRLIPESETKAAMEQFAANKRKRLETELKKPYRPQKPVEVRFQEPLGLLKKGDQVSIQKVPDFETMASECGALPVTMSSVRTGDVFETRVDFQVIEKLVRLRLTRDELIAVVTVVPRTKSVEPWVTTEITP